MDFPILIEPLEARIAPATLSIGNMSISEGDSGTKQMTFTVTVDQAVPGGFAVHFATSDGADSAAGHTLGAKTGADYTGAYGDLTFSGTDTQKSFTIDIAGNTTPTLDKTFNVTLSNPTNGVSLGNNGQAVGTIVDDDHHVSVANFQALEGDSAGSNTANLVVSLDGPSTSPVTIHFQTVDGTAKSGANGNDYVAVSGDLTFNPGETTKTVPVTLNGDTAPGPDKTFTAKLTAPSSNVAISTATATGTIQNDDVASGTVTVADAKVLEGSAGSHNTADFVITLGTVQDNPVTIHYSTVADGTAVEGTDFTKTVGDITIPAGQTSVTVHVPVLGDTVAQDDKTFSFRIDAPSGSTPNHTTAAGTILNDDVDAGTTITVTDPNPQAEGNANGTMDFTVTLGAAQSHPVSIPYHTANGTAVAPGDYTAKSGYVTIDAGQTTGTISVPIVGDTTSEPNETFTLNLDAVGGANFTKQSATGTILNDDAPALSVSNMQVMEGDSGTKTAYFTISLDNPTTSDVTVHYKTVDGSAITGTDYFGVDNTATILAGQTSVQVPVEIQGNTAVEANKTFSLQLDSPTNATLAGGTVSATGTILNDDVTSGTSISVADAKVLEGSSTDHNTADFVITLGTVQNKPVTIHFSTLADGTALEVTDFTKTVGDITIPANTASVVVHVPVIGNSVAQDDKTFSFKIDAPSGSTPDKTTAAGTILNDDVDKDTTITITDPNPQAEGNANGTMDFTVTLGTAQSHPVSIPYHTSNGTAVALGDYTAKTGYVTIDAHQTTGTISVPIVGDTISEPNETFTVNLDTVGGVNFTKQSATGTILNDDAPALSVGNIQVLEGNSGNKTAYFTISLANPTTSDVTVHYKTVDGSALADTDYVGVDKSVTIHAGDTSVQVPVDIKGNTTAEANKTFTLQIDQPTNATIASSTGTATILNDDVSSGTKISIADPTAKAEGNSGTSNIDFTVTLGAAQSFPVSVPYKTVDVTTSSGDYTGTTDGFITIDANQTSGTIHVPIVGDTTPEANETFTVNLDHVGNAVFTKQSATGTILNDDAPGLSIGDIQVAEGNSGTKNATFTITLDYPTTEAITVHYKTINDGTGGTAVAGADYTATDASVTIPAGATSCQVTVPILGNTTPEASKTFTVQLYSPTNATLTDATSVGTILNDDPTSGFSISKDHTSFSYTDIDGDLVTVKSSKALFTSEAVVGSAFHFSATGSNTQWFQLEGIDFTQLDNRLQTGSDLTLSVQEANGGNGLVNVGYIKSSTDLGKITIPGDLGQITVGDGVASTLALKLLDVGSMGAQGTATGASSLVSTFYGPVGTIHVDNNLGSTAYLGHVTTGNVINAHLNFVDASTVGSGSVNSLIIDGALTGGSDSDSGEISLSGKLVSATIGNIIGGSGANSGSVLASYFTSPGIGSIKVLGSVIGDTGLNSGSIAAPAIANVWIAGDLTGNSGNYSGVVQGGNLLGTVYVGGSVKGGDYFDADHAAKGSGQIFANTINSVTINGDLVGGKGMLSGEVHALGTLAFVKVHGLVKGGSAGTAAVAADPANNIVAQAAQAGRSGIITANKIGTVIVDTAIEGGNYESPTLTGDTSGVVLSETSIDSVQIGKDAVHGISILGGSGMDSGQIFAKTNLGTVVLAGSLIGGDGPTSGVISALGAINSVIVGGNIEGGNGFLSGAVTGPGTLGKMILAGDLKGGNNANSGYIAGFSSIGSVQVGGSIKGSAGFGSGQISADAINAVIVGGNIEGGSGVKSGVIGSSGTIALLDVHGSIIGGTAGVAAIPATEQTPAQDAVSGFSGVVSAYKLKTVNIGGAIVGGTHESDSQTGKNSGAVISSTSIDSITVGKDANGLSILGKTAENSAYIFAGTSLGKVILAGSLQGGAANVSGGVIGMAASGSVQVAGDVIGGAGNASGQLNFPQGAKLVSIGGKLTGSSGEASGTVLALSVQTVQVGGDVSGGGGKNSGQLNFSQGVKMVSIGGNLTGSSGEASGTVVALGVGSTGIGILQIKGDVTGGIGKASGGVAGESLGTVSIGGTIQGGNGVQSGLIFSNSTIGSINVVGSLKGGHGESSGVIETNLGRISTAKIGGDIQGDAGKQSGFLSSDSLGTVFVGGSVIGDVGESSGAIHSDATAITSLTINGKDGLKGGAGVDSGTIAGKGLSKTKILGDVQGGAGANSGSISVIGGNINGLSLGSLNGGTGTGSGSIITDGIISNTVVSKNIDGGDTASGSISKTGYIQARKIASLVVGGTLKAGAVLEGAAEGATLTDSGSIRATETIVSLTVGSLEGSATNNAIIAAAGPATLLNQTPVGLAIQSLTIKGDVNNAEILAGYGLADSTNPRGAAVNADAQIGTVTVNGNWTASSLVAGVIAGADGHFGTGDDAIISGSGTSDSPSIYSKISSLIVKGNAEAASGNYGIVSQNVVAAKFAGVLVNLEQGPSNDLQPITVNNVANLAVLEVAAAS